MKEKGAMNLRVGAETWKWLEGGNKKGMNDILYFNHKNKNIKEFILYICVWAHICHSYSCVWLEDNFQQSVLFFALWVLRIDLKALGLVPLHTQPPCLSGSNITFLDMKKMS